MVFLIWFIAGFIAALIVTFVVRGMRGRSR
ncbi:hypothetical protein N007_14655 [Alicyclobacillus acidoterrestris ATCC 49025]|nr:hypothetical protein N007_14655 [Alicyclobacillus acidoterrestris ATCC 49025]